MEGHPLLLGQIVALVIGDEVNQGAIRESRGLIQDDAAFLNARSQGAHSATRQAALVPRNPVR